MKKLTKKFRSPEEAQMFAHYAYETEGMTYRRDARDASRVIAGADYDPQVHAAVVRNFREDWGF
jgi:hypothetical protein